MALARAQARAINAADARLAPRHQQQALDLARALPRLVIEARRVSSAVAHGVHGRRRPGVGENFWQFRHFASGEATARVDWRRSARDDHLYVREREWEAAHTVWLWCDRSASMAYVSELAQAPKIERGLVLVLALADMLVRGGERVGLLDMTRPSASRVVVERLAEALLRGGTEATALPVAAPLAPLTEAVLIGDFLGPVEETATTVRSLSSRGARGHLMMISDPIEEVFPFSGRTELVDPEGGTLTAGRVQALRSAYVDRLAAHRDTLRAEVRRLGWTLTLHRTDRMAAEALLGLHGLLMAVGGTPQ